LTIARPSTLTIQEGNPPRSTPGKNNPFSSARHPKPGKWDRSRRVCLLTEALPSRGGKYLFPGDRDGRPWSILTMPGRASESAQGCWSCTEAPLGVFKFGLEVAARHRAARLLFPPSHRRSVSSLLLLKELRIPSPFARWMFRESRARHRQLIEAPFSRRASLAVISANSSRFTISDRTVHLAEPRGKPLLVGRKVLEPHVPAHRAISKRGWAALRKVIR
jgi:hypothetical protein